MNISLSYIPTDQLQHKKVHSVSVRCAQKKVLKDTVAAVSFYIYAYILFISHIQVYYNLSFKHIHICSTFM